MTTTKTRDPLQGYRILRGSVNVGDYIRFASGNPSMREQWRKVASLTPAAHLGGSDMAELVNAAGHARLVGLKASDKIVRHPYSQKLADPANYLPLED